MHDNNLPDYVMAIDEKSAKFLLNELFPVSLYFNEITREITIDGVVSPVPAPTVSPEVLEDIKCNRVSGLCVESEMYADLCSRLLKEFNIGEEHYKALRVQLVLAVRTL